MSKGKNHLFPCFFLIALQESYLNRKLSHVIEYTPLCRCHLNCSLVSPEDGHFHVPALRTSSLLSDFVILGTGPGNGCSAMQVTVPP